MEFFEFDKTSYMICDIYEAKCDELDIENTDELRLRFVHEIESKIPQGIIDLSDEKLTKSCAPSIVALIQHLGSEIHTLILDNNPFDDVGINSLKYCEEELINYKVLSLVSVGLSPEGLIDFFSLFPSECQLQSLNLGSNPSAERRNRFNEESSKFLGQFVCSLKNIQEVNLENTEMRGTNGVNFARFLDTETPLKCLELENTGISNSALHLICISKALPFLESLNLSGNETLTGECCQDIAELILYKRHFHTLYINDLQFDDQLCEIFKAFGYKSAEELAEQEAFERRNAIREHERDEELCNLHYGIKNLIKTGKVLANDEETSKIVEQQNKEESEDLMDRTCAISVLEANNCKVSALNLKIFSDALTRNESLKALSLDNAGIDLNKRNALGQLEYIEPFAAFTQALTQHPRISSIKLNKNSILDVGATNFYELLENKTISSLQVNYCRIGNDGVVNIAKGLGKAVNLKELRIAGNNCDDIAGEALFTNLQNYTKLKILDISLNKISFEFTEKIQLLIRENIEESCSEVYQSLMERVNELENELNELNFIDVETVRYRTEYNDLVKELVEQTENLLLQHDKSNEELQNEYTKLEDLRLAQNMAETKLADETIKVNELETRMDEESAICEQKKRIIRDKTQEIEREIEAIEEEEAEEESDEELEELEKRLERREIESRSLEKENVNVLSQLAACEAILVKEGIVQIAEPRKTKK